MKKLLYTAAIVVFAFSISGCSSNKGTQETKVEDTKVIETKKDETKKEIKESKSIKDTAKEDETVTGELLPTGVDWNGNFTNGVEAVHFEAIDNHSTEFTFAFAGFFGTAQVEEDKATYQEDSGFKIVFEQKDGKLIVTTEGTSDNIPKDMTIDGTYELDK